ncbi:MAG: hypothetical protein NZ937_01840 [Armatimonadetes bacterium]|nr:hypothetical protein [Armatimonadota bacterium]
MRFPTLIFALITVTTVSVAQRLPLKIEVRPPFGTTVPSYGCLPLKIIIQNEGPSIDATLVVSPSRIRAERLHLFPISLPTGSRKEITALPFVMPNTMSVSVRLEGVRGMPEQTISVSANDNVRLVVGVGDEIGGLEWLKHLNSKPSTSPRGAPVWRPGSPMPMEWVWAYCRPEDLPDKAGALTGVSAIVLGTGAERLTMAQWRAIRRWVMMGGVLVVSGGSAAIYLRHVFLASMLPIQNWRTFKHSDWDELARWLQIQPPSEPAFITTGSLTPDAQILAGTNKLPLVTVRPYGYGAVLFIAFNLWDKPFRAWQGLPYLWRKSVAPLTNATVAQLWSTWIYPLGEWQGWQQYYPPYAVPYSSSRAPQPPTLPFRLELPSVANLAVTLLIYFALIVPISYAFLRRRRALDWHWFIAPAFAIAFVLIVGQATLGLHHLGTQNLTRGLIVTAAGEQDAYLLAGSTLFIQRAGNYLLDFGNAEGVFTQVREFGDFMGSMTLETQDGETVSTVLRVPNLSFRLFYFAKPITLRGKVDVQVKRRGNTLQVTVTNRLPFALKEGECRLVSVRQVANYEPWRSAIYEYSPISTTRLPELAPQETATVNLPIPRSPIRSPSPIRIVMTAQVEGMNITPNLNTASQSKSYVTLQIVKSVQ